MNIADKELHRVAVTAIIYTSDRTYLITRRSLAKKAFPGKWMVPGGGITVDDYINEAPSHGTQWYHVVEKALRREVREETGLEIGTPEYLIDLTFVRPDNIPVLVLSYFAPYVGGSPQIKLDLDTVDAKWVTAEEAKQYDLLEGLLEEIQMVDKILSSR